MSLCTELLRSVLDKVSAVHHRVLKVVPERDLCVLPLFLGFATLKEACSKYLAAIVGSTRVASQDSMNVNLFGTRHEGEEKDM